MKFEYDITGIVTAILAVLIVVGALAYRPYRCEAQAEKMGMKHDFGYIQGCMIEHKPGQWILIDNYRQF